MNKEFVKQAFKLGYQHGLKKSALGNTFGRFSRASTMAQGGVRPVPPVQPVSGAQAPVPSRQAESIFSPDRPLGAAVRGFGEGAMDGLKVVRNALTGGVVKKYRQAADDAMRSYSPAVRNVTTGAANVGAGSLALATLGAAPVAPAAAAATAASADALLTRLGGR